MTIGPQNCPDQDSERCGPMVRRERIRRLSVSDTGSVASMRSTLPDGGRRCQALNKKAPGSLCRAGNPGAAGHGRTLVGSRSDRG